jgi:hypothetical protein
VNESGAAIAGVKAVPRKRDSNKPWPPVLADKAGRVTIGELPVSQWMLTVQAPDLPEADLGPFAIGAGAPTDLGDLVLARGGTLLVRLVSDAPLGEGWIRGIIVPASVSRAFPLTRDGAVLRSTALPVGAAQLSIDARSFAPVRQAVQIAAGVETTVDVRLVAGVQQRLRVWAPAATLQATGSLHWSLGIHDAQGASIVEVDRDLPAIDSHAVDPSQPFMDLGWTLAPGAYTVDLVLGDVARRGLNFIASADAPWDIDLR